MIRGLIFDLDGVIVDTAKYHFIAWKELADKLGIPFTLKDNERLKGVSRVRSFEIILEIGNRAMTAEQIQEYCEWKNNRYLEYINRLKESEILPGAKQFLLDARADGYRVGLGSASKNTALILDKLNITALFDAVIDGNKVSKAKPDPEVFVRCAADIGLRPSECVVFEDAEAGVEAAHNGGMIAVGIGSRDRLPDADVNLDGFEGITPQELIRRIKALQS